MNVELKPIAESKIRQLGGDVCGVLVRKDDRLAAVDEHGRVTWLQSGQGAEPVFWWDGDLSDLDDCVRKEQSAYHTTPLYTQPQPAQQGSVPEGWRELVNCVQSLVRQKSLSDSDTISVGLWKQDPDKPQFHAQFDFRVAHFNTTPQPEGDGNKRHWYALSYRGKDRESGCAADAVTYTGYPENALTIARIQAAKADAGVNDKAVLVCATYLGHMTKEEFTAQPAQQGGAE